MTTQGTNGRGIDPITLSTVWHALQSTGREMRHVIDRTAQNYLMAQLHDMAAGIWDVQGRTIAVPEGPTSMFLSQGFTVKYIMERMGRDLRPGDVILCNDPYKGYCNHLPDWGFFRPVFYKDELVFIVLTRGHQLDTGGAFPGGYFPNGYDIHAEGIMIPPIKVISEGRERTDVLELIWNNVRWPEGVRIDNYSMIAATKVCEQRLTALLDRYGRDMVVACCDEMVNRTERAVRAEIARIPDGTYIGESATDDDGTVLDEPVWVRLDLTVRGDEMTLDFSRSDAQRKGFVNAILATTYGDAVAATVLFFDTALADFHNEGTLRPLRFVVPEGLVVNCQYPATVGGSPVNVSAQIMEAVMEALSKALPQRSIAAWGKHRGDYVSSVDPRSGERYVRTSFDYDGSCGAVYGYDGYQGVATLTGLGALNRGNMEEMEIRVPWRLLQYEMVADFTGAGRWRGGPGIHWVAVNEGADGIIATGSSDGDEILGFGAHGGSPSPPCRTYIRRNTGKGMEDIRLKPHRLVPIQPGDIIVKHSSGGGGVGPPAERDPELVRQDVVNELVSPEAARDVYKVALDPKTLAIDREGTRALRAAR